MEAGPPLETLTRRLAECPADFLAEPYLGGQGVVRVAAVVSDVLTAWGNPPLTRAQAAAFAPPDGVKHRNWLQLVLVACWLLQHDWFLSQPAPGARALLTNGLCALADVVPAPRCVADPDRREELARVCLQALGLYPRGETPAQALDRLTALDSVERRRVMRAARQAEARSRAIRAAMVQAAAQEAADKWTRE